MFSGCYNLKEISIPKSVKYIGKQAFYNCNLLEKIILHENIETIEEYAFLILDNATIYVPLESDPEGWANKWATNVKNIVYGYIEE